MKVCTVILQAAAVSVAQAAQNQVPSIIMTQQIEKKNNYLMK